MVQKMRDDVPSRVEELEQTLASVRADSEVAYVLLGLSGALAEVRSVEETLEIAVRTTAELFGADRCFAARWDPAHALFELHASWGYSNEDLDDLAASATGPDAYPLLQRALKDGEPLMVPDANPLEEGAGIAIPLVRWGEQFGGLRLGFDQPREFGAKDVALARGVARQVGVALNNARRFQLLQVLRSFGQKMGSGLSLARVANAVLEGTRELLSADGAWIYFLDPSRRSLLSAGSSGGELALPERLARLSLAEPPWSSLLSGGAPVTVDLATHFGFEGELIGVATPLPSGRTPFAGALLAVLDGSKAPGHEDLEAFQVLAAQSGQAIDNARRHDRDRSVARALQKALLSAELPRIEGYEVEALYEAADGEADVGGDLYDVFELSDGRYALVVGDVSGKGAEAAAQTAMVKYTVRAFATRDPTPSSVLFHLNSSLLRDLPEDRFVTIFYALLEPGRGRCQFTVAGHPAPLLLTEDGAVRPLPSHGTIVGALEGEEYEQTSMEIAPGEVLLAYTDGLVESRSGDALFGVDRVKESLRRNVDQPDLVRRIFADARSFGRVTDDTVVLAVRRKD